MLLAYLRTEGHDRPLHEPLLATSDVLESLFGKYKRDTERRPQTEMNSAILTLPVAMQELTPQFIKDALLTTPLKRLNHWCRATFGRTKQAVQRLLTDLLPATEPASKPSPVNAKFSTG